jgi:iron complex outermembrane receptor protein
VAATFRSRFVEFSPSNPFANASGDIEVGAGDRLPGIPEHQLKMGADYHLAPGWLIGAIANYYSSQFLRGDESNRNPPLRPYTVLNLHGSYRATSRIELFANISNALDARYSTFGIFGDPTGVGAPGIPAGARANGPGVDNRFYGPAPPIAVYGGIRLLLH